MNKPARLEIFLSRLTKAPPAKSAEEAEELLATLLNQVEDEFSGVVARPSEWLSNGRLYPPQADSQVKCPERRWLKKFRSKGHYTYIGANGSIRIETVGGELMLDKAGADRRKAFELTA